jgi:anti-sigma B factor antagonist
LIPSDARAGGENAAGPAMDQNQPEPFSIRVLPRQDGTVCVRVTGEVDLCTAPELELALTREIDAGSKVLLDLSRVSFIDSSGLRAIAMAARMAQSNGSALELDSSLPDQARRVIEISGLHGLLGVE